ncbi:MAG TPA: ribose-phosphate pyrophosphokinase [Ramlibacter sp.]|nr:ribose-phosphate pyrophosphokinase [Ramlibacter sp.]
MKNLILALPGAEELGESLAQQLHCGAIPVEIHRFPDGEQRVRLCASTEGCRVLLAAHLDHPDDRTLPLVFAADAARELGAGEVGLVAPYLPYMRQDKRFQPGEAITSRSYARLLSAPLDFLVTVDPHLHRWRSLDVIYRIRTQVVSAAPAIAAWLQRELPDCVLIGPDGESAQWVADVAGRIGAPFVVLEKERHGDREVLVHLPSDFDPQGRTPVLVDDIVSTGQTLIAAAQALRSAGWGAPTAVTVHALMEREDVEALHRAGVPRIVSCDTVTHPTNAISVRGLLAEALRGMLA